MTRQAHAAHTAVTLAVAAALERAEVAPDAMILAAVSGGADSVAMLCALHEIAPRAGIRLAAAHLNHRLRGSESDSDEAFVRDLCARLGVPLEVGHADTLAADMPNLEEAAREARHDYLGRTARRLGAGHLALAHNSGDQAETVLMRLLRGAGVSGLGAMDESGPGLIVRPMLTLERATIERYLRAIGQSWIEDSTNASSAMLRNRVRSDLLPYLEREYAPGLSGRLVELGAEMRAVDEYLSRAAEIELLKIRRADGALDLAGFAPLDPALKPVLMRQYVAEGLGGLRRVSRTHIDALLRVVAAGPPNGAIALPGGWRALRAYSWLRLVRGTDAPAERYCIAISPQGDTIIPAAGYAFSAAVVARDEVSIPADPMTALFDAREVTGRTLFARNFSPGDRITPLGMRGTRKVKDVFIDHKLARSERAKFPVVVMEDRIVWLPGLVRSGSAMVTDWTEAVLRLEARRL
jgi:tRNA(Ile)-lysidine synthase